ncbi:MAG: MYXO-CTERM sorting domain-containing protein [Myxococcota bacterium]
MIATGAASLLVALFTGCDLQRQVVVDEAISDEAFFNPSFRYAYFREDPLRNRIHLRFTNYWNPCITDAQVQNQLRNDETPAQQAESWASLMPRDLWSADVYLQVPQWPAGSQTDLSFPVIPDREASETGEEVVNYGLLCLLRQCPFEEQCDTCLPSEPGAEVGFTRTTNHLETEYFDTAGSVNLVQRHAVAGSVEISVWNPAAPTGRLDTGSAETTINPLGEIGGVANLILRNVGADTDAGTIQFQFAAPICEPLQATYTPSLASFDLDDLENYPPPGCNTAPTGAAYAAAGVFGLLLLRRRRHSATTGHQASNA